MKKLVGIGLLGLLFFVPACNSTQEKGSHSPAMKAELAAKDFYESLKDILQDEKNRKMLQILANMEQGHYDILAKELENLKQFEDYDSYWPMMHVGP